MKKREQNDAGRKKNTNNNNIIRDGTKSGGKRTHTHTGFPKNKNSWFHILSWIGHLLSLLHLLLTSPRAPAPRRGAERSMQSSRMMHHREPRESVCY